VSNIVIGMLLCLASTPAPIHAAGLTWPADKVFPRFAAMPTATPLDVIDVTGFTYDRKVLFTVLQGLVNRTAPRIYILDGQQSGEGKNFWIDKLTVGKNKVADPFTLLTKYKAEVKGLYVYDPEVMATVNLAVTSAGLNGGVAVSPALASTLSAAPYGFAVSADYRTNAFADDRAAYRWALVNLWPKCTHRMLAGLKPGTHYPLLDYVVANQAMSIWMDPGIAGDKALLDSMFSQMPVNGVFLGWWPGETPGVAYASGFGVITFAADWFANASVHGTESQALGALPALAPPPPLQNKCYVAMILSDGDNLQEQEHLFPIRWNDANRGSFPVSWTQSPALADFAPGIMNHFYGTATPNDCFITGPSGVGYVYPGNWKRADFPKFAKLTEDYLARTGIRTATIWGTTDWASDLYGENCPSLLGMATFGNPLGVHVWKKGIASVDMLPTYASFASQILEGQDGINTRLAAWNKSKPMFIAPQLNANVAGLPEFRKVYDALKANPDVVFVRADQLFQLIRLANGGTGVGPGAVAESLSGKGMLSLNAEFLDGTYRIRYAVPQAGPLEILVADHRGRVLKRTRSQSVAAGRHELLWDGRAGSGVASGSERFLVRMRSGGSTLSSRFQ
jgi:hypothetical protein